MDESRLEFKEYNRSNKERARDLRKNQTLAENIIWENVLRKKQTGFLFLRQKMIWSFILDFYCSKLLLGIEVDWNSHDDKKEYDKERDERMRKHGIKIIRFTNDEVIYNTEWIKKEIKEILIKRSNEIKLINSLPWQREG